jgi:hypothetical protein
MKMVIGDFGQLKWRTNKVDNIPTGQRVKLHFVGGQVVPPKSNIEEISKSEQFRIIVDALLSTRSKRPDVWYQLVAELINDGFKFNHPTAEWINDEPVTIRGKACFTEAQAWLRHWDNTQSHHVGERLEINPDIELRVGTRIRLIRAVERYPFFIAKAGLEGVITENSGHQIAAKMDVPLAGSEEWNNAIIWEDEAIEQFVDDVQLIGYS